MLARRALILLGILSLFGAMAFPAGSRLTIYNQNFAVVRVDTPLDLKQGINHVQLSDVTAYLEPDSVILRDPSGNYPFRIIEQNYRADPVAEGSMLQLYEGKTIDFLVMQNGHNEVVRGKIIRSGYAPPGPVYSYPQPYGIQQQYPQLPRQPVIEVNGQLRFSLPGQPLFPALTEGSILKPMLSWLIESQKAGHISAELSYVTEGMDWDATYNAVEPASGKTLNLLGWVTMHNRSGKDFENAQIKLMAGTVSKIQPPIGGIVGGVPGGIGFGVGGNQFGPPLVTQTPFDEYHLYELHRPVTLRDQETKQVEFIRAAGIDSALYYVYDGLEIQPNQYNGWNMEMIRQNRDYGTESAPGVRVMHEFINSTANHLGIPLPAGRLRFYRQDQNDNLEFLGESRIPHTPENETVSVYTGNAFDLKGERRRTNYVIDNARHTLDESFEIRLRNHKPQPVEIRVDERLYRGDTWDIIQHSNAFVKQESHTIEFRVEVPSNGEKTLTYTVHYTW